MKKIILLLAITMLVYCKEKPETEPDKVPEFLAVEVNFEDGLSKELIINLKEKYYVYANSNCTASKARIFSSDTIFKLDSGEVEEIIERYKKVRPGRFYAIEDTGNMHTRIECVYADKSFYLLQDGKVRTAGQREFLRILLAVLMTKTEDDKIFIELTEMFGGMAEY